MRNVDPTGRTPPCRASPFRTAPIPCSRTPKWMLRAPQLPAATSPPCLKTTLVEVARSADPPTSSGSFVGDVKRLEAGPAEALLRELHLVLAERRAVGLGRVLLVRTAVRDVGAHDDQRRPVRDTAAGGERRVERAEIVAVRHALHVPTVALEPLRRVV